MPAVDNLVYQTTTTTGTGDKTLVLETGWRAFQAAFGLSGAASQFYYFVRHQDAAENEWGEGHLDGSGNLVSDVVLGGSNGTSAVNFTAGTKEVVCDLPAERQLDPTWTFVSSALTAGIFARLACDTSAAAFTVILPTNPATGGSLWIADAGASWGTNALTVAGNGNTIEGDTTLTADVADAAFELFYDGTEWKIRNLSAVDGGLIGPSPYVNVDGTTSLTGPWKPQQPISGVPFARKSVSATSYTFVADDAGELVLATSSSGQTFTIPDGVFSVGTMITIIQTASGQVTIAPGTNQTLVNRQGYTKTAGQHAVISLIQHEADTWVMAGDAV